jgi:hypothetical protein
VSVAPRQAKVDCGFSLGGMSLPRSALADPVRLQLNSTDENAHYVGPEPGCSSLRSTPTLMPCPFVSPVGWQGHMKSYHTLAASTSPNCPGYEPTSSTVF